MEQEKKLAEYRAKKKREQQINKVKDNVSSVMNIFRWRKETPVETSENEVMLDENDSDSSTEEFSGPTLNTTTIDPLEAVYPTSRIRYEFYILFAVLWIATFVLFIKLQFGIIYLIISAIFGIFLNTRTGPKDKNEISAYSVFNKDCKSIDGTLKGEQFEREIRFGALNVH